MRGCRSGRSRSGTGCIGGRFGRRSGSSCPVEPDPSYGFDLIELAVSPFYKCRARHLNDIMHMNLRTVVPGQPAHKQQEVLVR
jgi:hypothetical protein